MNAFQFREDEPMANVTYDKNCLTVLDHPLVGHKMTILRVESTVRAQVG